ncbi:MAG: shikimate dehydrogenase [Pseudohongiellaceae bacterium]
MVNDQKSGASTRYAVIGSPIAHSKSPRIHSLFAEQTKQNLTYEAIEVLEADFESFVNAFFESGGGGLNVTVPHKERAFAMAEVTSPRATLARAVNTLSLNNAGQLEGDNTDGAGLLNDLLNNHGTSIESKRLLILGAGGATRGVLAAIADLENRPVAIKVANRTLARATALASDFSPRLAISAVGYDELHDQQFDVIINGTSASLGGELPPLLPSLIAPDCCCYDMMYAAEPTLFLKWAKAHGAAQAIDGLGMLVGQAALAFTRWRGVAPTTNEVILALRQGF